MSKIGHNGGPAFPLLIEEEGCITQVHLGMTLRDYFAGQALMSLPHLCAHDTLMNGMTFEQHIARNAYRLADAMLAARKGGAA
jgi:hypothetical protein